MKYAFIEQNECDVPTARQCRWLGVSSSGYYDWRARRDRARPRPRSDHRAVVDEAVRIAFAAARERYGSPRLTVELNASGFAVAENTVAASLRRQGLVAKAGRKFKATTNSAHALAVSPNLLGQDFTCERINQKWCGDITYLWCDEGWMYLATVIDLYSRRVIGWSVSHRMTRQLVCDAMMMAIEARSDIAGVIMHTDRGSQYCSDQFRALLRGHEICSSMSARGDCFDNACAESFFHSLKIEAIHGERFKTRESVRTAVFEYIELYYNPTRRHSASDNTSPVKYELANAA